MPDEDRAVRYCREGVGRAVAVYVDARTAAEALLDTHSVADVARVLTGVPESGPS